MLVPALVPRLKPFGGRYWRAVRILVKNTQTDDSAKNRLGRGSDLVKMAGNLLDRPGIRRKTLCVDQQISYGNGHIDRLLQLSDRPNRYRRHSNSNFGVHREQFDVDLTICVYFTRILTALQPLSCCTVELTSSTNESLERRQERQQGDQIER
jgi:hypothetical protein